MRSRVVLGGTRGQIQVHPTHTILAHNDHAAVISLVDQTRMSMDIPDKKDQETLNGRERGRRVVADIQEPACLLEELVPASKQIARHRKHICIVRIILSNRGLSVTKLPPHDHVTYASFGQNGVHQKGRAERAIYIARLHGPDKHVCVQPVEERKGPGQP